jgi:hypothetical protein
MQHQALQQGEGIVRLAPAWVPRSFCIPGKRLKLHPSDLYAFGAHRGGIDERWLASTVKADNGPETTPDEGLSHVVYGDADKPQQMLFADLVQEAGEDLLGDEIWNRYHGWPIFAKFFDNKGALPHHLHQDEAHAALVGRQPKPEAYYFPYQLNNYLADVPYTFFGLNPGTTREQLRHCLEIWDEGDNHILELSRAFRLERGTGWYVPPGTLHAPGSLVTYEPQWASDVLSMFQSLVNEVPTDWSLVVKDVPPDKHHDLDFIVSLADWDINVNPRFKETHFRPPVPVKDPAAMADEGYVENWITYGNPYFAAKELTVLPGRTVTIRDAGPYGLIVLQGHGTLNNRALDTPALIRFGQLTEDEYFVSCQVGRAGVKITNPSRTEPIVMLKHFTANPEAPAAPTV